MKTAPKNHEQEKKTRFSLIPLDILEEILCPAYEEGLLKYFRESWRHGFKQSVMYDACQRHLKAWFYECETYDPETKEKYGIDKPHLGAAIFCICSMWWTYKIGKRDLDDRPKHIKVLKGPIYGETETTCDNKP